MKNKKNDYIIIFVRLNNIKKHTYTLKYLNKKLRINTINR